MKVLHVVGSRPNFMKVAPIMAEMADFPGYFQQVLIHTGQHYDDNMSKRFFEDLDMPSPDEFLNIGSGTHASQTARIMMAFEPALLKYNPDLVIVVGDVNSTLACALVCAKMCIPVAHVEAGLRSFDRTMPEEINRIMTDSIARWLFVSEPSGVQNLLQEGNDKSNIHLVGNVMIDTLDRNLPKARALGMPYRYRVTAGSYGVVTLHRPSNVDDTNVLNQLIIAFKKLSDNLPLIFPVHPRTYLNLQRLIPLSMKPCEIGNIHICDPLGYHEFLGLVADAKVVITDSGGLQEETSALGIPCLTVRETTERPITITEGTSTLVGQDIDKLLYVVNEVLEGTYKQGKRPDLWDGKAAKRIASKLM